MRLQDELIPTLKALPNVDWVKIYDGHGTTLRPNGLSDSYPECLFPCRTSAARRAARQDGARAPVAQLAEASRLNRDECRFEPCRGHQIVLFQTLTTGSPTWGF